MPKKSDALTLGQAIRGIKAGTFWKPGKGLREPNYPAIFVEVVAAILDDRGVKYQRSTLEAIAEHVNPSTYQRSVAVERALRIGHYETRDGKTIEVTRRPAKDGSTKSPRPDPISGGLARRGVDPITGEAKGKKKAARATKATPKAAKSLSLAGQRRAARMGKSPKESAPDPIEGEGGASTAPLEL